MPDSPVLTTLARRFAKARLGTSGAPKDYTVDYRMLVRETAGTNGEALAQAEADLDAAERHSSGLLQLDRHPRDPTLVLRVRLAAEGGEDWLFAQTKGTSPSNQRRRQEAFFAAQAVRADVPAQWQQAWRVWNQRLQKNAARGSSISPFQREHDAANQELADVLVKILSWEGESLIRFASCVICGDSKRLETLAPLLEMALFQISSGAVSGLDQLGLVRNPRFVLLHGPLQLETTGGWVNLGLLSGPVRLSLQDLTSALQITTSAPRLLTVENETTFHELAKKQSGTLLVQTSYPGSALLALFARLPQDLPCWHFGDADPAGFDILRDLRQRTGRVIQPLHMNFRDDGASPSLQNRESELLGRLLTEPLLQDVREALTKMQAAGRKGAFEQESLGWPAREWPFHTSEPPSAANEHAK